MRDQQDTAPGVYDLGIFFEHNLDLLCIADTGGFFRKNNSRWQAVLGYSAGELEGRRFLDFVHPDDLPATLEAIGDLAAIRDVINFANRYRHRDGSYRWLEWCARSDGTLIYATAREMTGRKEAEARINESEQRFRSLFETLHEGFALHEVICDGAGRVVDYRYLDINPAFEQLTGLRRAETVGRTVREVIPGIEEEWISTFGRVAMTGVPEERESYVADLDRHYRARAYSPQRGQFAVVFEEITTQKRQQQELEQREARYHSLMDSIPLGVTLIGRDYRIITVNQAHAAMFGHPPEWFQGRLCHEVFEKRDCICPHCPGSVAMSTGSRASTETVGVRDDGSSFSVRIFSVPVLGEDGQATGFIEVVEDITERKESEAALREQQQMISAIVESSQDWIWAIDVDGHHTFSNQAVYQILGYSPDEFRGMGLELMHPEDRELVKSLWPAWVDSRQGWRNLALRWRSKDGSYRFLESTAVPIIDHRGELLGFRGVDRDITERHQAEMALSESEERFRSITALSPDIISIIGRDGSLIYNSPSALTVHGYTSEDMQGINTFELIHPDDRNSVEGAFLRLLEAPHQTVTVEYRYRNRDGSYNWMECSAINLLANPLINGVLAISRDIRDRKQLEQQLLLAQKSESLGVLAGGVAHDLNNILTAIIGNADLALKRSPPASPVQDNLQRIEQAAVRAADLARQMLAYSGKGKFVIETLDLSRLVEEMGQMVAATVSRKAELRYRLSRPIPAVNADATQLRQIIMNLAINASDSLGAADGEITITTGFRVCSEEYLRDAWLPVPVPPGGYVFLEVADTGCGMDRETLTRVFDPFFTTKFTGRGLGMAAVLGIVKGHHGCIRVVSEPGVGSTFTILLPATHGAAGPGETTRPRDGWKGRGTVLLVDDEATVREIGCELLKELGYAPLTAADGREALEVFRSIPSIAFVILDLTMPHMDGEQCFLELRRCRPDAAIILSSGYNEQEVSQKFAGRGLAGFIQKPYNLSDLAAAIRRLSVGNGP